MDKEIKQKILKAGKIAKEVREWIKPKIKKGMLLLDIADMVEMKIREKGGEPAFPVNLSINEVAAHYTPKAEDETKAFGLLKVDFGVHIDGWVADNAFSVDLEDNGENKKLIASTERALDNALKIVGENIRLGDVGKVIQDEIENEGFAPVINLSGHSIDEYELHAGVTIPNVDDNREIYFNEGLYAIEPFATFGGGRVHDGNPSGIYELVSEKNVRSPMARKVLNFIIESYETLPFCSRWIAKELGVGALFGLKQLEENGNLHQFSQLVESSREKVAQTEHTILIDDGKVIVTTK